MDRIIGVPRFLHAILGVAVMVVALTCAGEERAFERASIDRRVVAFKAAIQEPLSIDARTSLAVESQVHAILAAASMHLAGAANPGGDEASLLAINRILASKGLLLHLEISTTDGLPVIESVSVSGFEPEKGGTLGTKVFESLLGPNPYPDISVFQATEETVFSRRDAQFEWITPGRVVVLNDSAPLVLIYPEAIRKQSRAFGVSVELVEELVRINETAHVLLDMLIGRSEHELTIPELEIVVSDDGDRKIVVPALSRAQFHELFSDTATLSLATDFPATLMMLWGQADEQHRPSHDLLVAATAFALEDWSNAADAAALSTERRQFVTTLLPKNGDDLDAPRALANALRQDHELQAYVREVVTGILAGVSHRVVTDLAAKRL
jgi:hypothetical protein